MLMENPIRHMIRPPRIKGDRIFSLSEDHAKENRTNAGCRAFDDS